MTIPTDSLELKRRLTEFARRASTEVTTHDEGLLPALVGKLDAGTTIYVAHTPKASLADLVRVSLKVESLGFRASPHLVARRIRSERDLRETLAELKRGGVEQALTVAGDLDKPVGPFLSSLDVLEVIARTDTGFKRLGVAGHPEGNKAIGPTKLWEALRHKQEFAERTGIKMHIVSQFGFNPQVICDWGQDLKHEGIALPVHAGMAGPTSIAKLLQFAMRCGVATSMHSIMQNAHSMGHLAASAADETLVGLVKAGAGFEIPRIAKPHVFTFGGVLATARWLHAIAAGAFELQAGGRLEIHG